MTLDVLTDLAVKDYSELVKAEHWRPLVLQFRKVRFKHRGLPKAKTPRAPGPAPVPASHFPH